MPADPNFDDFDLEKNSSESGIDGFDAFDEIGKTSDERPLDDDGPVFGNDESDSSYDAAEESQVEGSDLSGAAAAIATSDAETEVAPKKRRLPKLTVFEVMLILSFVFITLATIKLFFALNMYGDFPGSFPWKTSGT